MDLTIVIVNYNVKHFLIQCLQSIAQSVGDFKFEIIVIDNASTDGSREDIPKLFPEINYIYNIENVGFGKANNQGIAIAKGEYTLLLNPDTIIQSDTLIKCVSYLRNHPQIGGLGIKMIDGNGQFLPESKRSFPSPTVAFYKLFGLSSLFPESTKFGQYHLSYLDKDKNHEVEVLSGAFLMSSTELLKTIGGFDEHYFMYGEDIELSHEFSKRGYQNVYFSESTIVHYKGESTKLGSLNYVRHFYEAMIIFARRNLDASQRRFFIPMLQIAIYFRALFSVIGNFIKRIGVPMLDLFLSYLVCVIITLTWLEYKENIIDYPSWIYIINLPIYILISLASMYLSGAYDTPYRLPKIFRGGVFSVLLISLVYAFLPSSLRFSRALVVLSAIGITFSVLVVRMISQYLQMGQLTVFGSRKRSFLIAGDEQSLSIKDRLLQESPLYSFFGLIGLNNRNSLGQIGQIDELNQLTSTLKPTDIIFDTKAISFTQFIKSLENKKIGRLRFYTTNDYAETLIHSQNKNEKGEVIEFNNSYLLNFSSERRKKFLFDLVTSIVVILLSPFLIWFQTESKFKFIADSFQVLSGKKTWVGYIGEANDSLPQLNPGVLNPTGVHTTSFHQDAINYEINRRYAQFYSVDQDLDVLLGNLKNL